MNLDEDCSLTYIVNHEAWYASANNFGGRGKQSIGVHSSSSGGGVAWEFEVVGYPDINGGTVRVCMFGDSFQAWAEVPELFTALREETPSSLSEVRAILERVGARDRTERRTPEHLRPVSNRRDAVRSVLGDDAKADQVLAAIAAVEGGA